MSLIIRALELVDEDDHRVAAINMQSEGLDDAWAAVLGSALAANYTVRSVNLNK